MGSMGTEIASSKMCTVLFICSNLGAQWGRPPPGCWGCGSYKSSPQDSDRWGKEGIAPSSLSSRQHRRHACKVASWMGTHTTYNYTQILFGSKLWMCVKVTTLLRLPDTVMQQVLANNTRQRFLHLVCLSTIHQWFRQMTSFSWTSNFCTGGMWQV